MATIGERIRQLRSVRQITQIELARRAGISRQALGAIEAGVYQPNVSVALKIAGVLGESVEAVFGEEVEGSSRGMSALFAPYPGQPPVDRTRVVLARVNGKLVAAERPPAQIALTAAGGLVTRLRRNRADVTTFRSDDEIDSTLLIAGCDPAAAMIADFLVRRRSPIAAAAISCSSRQSLKSLTEGTVHAAGIHLRDPKTGEYNRRPRAIGRSTHLVNFARWELGLAAAPGNPHRIREISDLARRGVRIVNREPGAGARTALDEELATAGIECRAIHGYDRIVPGHLEVAAAIASGTADAGITIRVAADAYRLVFVPIREERYDLLIADQDADAEPLKALFDVLGSSRFAREIAELCGYDTSQMGKVMDAVN